MSSSFFGSTSNLNRPSSGVELLLKEKNKEAACKYIAGNDGKGTHYTTFSTNWKEPEALWSERNFN